MLHQNGSFTSQYPLKYMGGSYGVYERSCWNKPETVSTRFFTMAGMANVAAIPVGYNNTYTWAPALKAGGIGANRGINGSGVVSGAGALGVAPSAVLAGVGGITPPSLTGKGSISITITNVGAFTASTAAAIPASATITAQGIISNAAANSAGPLSATLMGEGYIPGALLNTVVQIIANLSGSGIIATANMASGKGLGATLAGATSFNLDLRGKANLGAVITLGGVSVQVDENAIAQAVLTASVESGYSVQEVLRILAAVAAGKTDIDTGPPVVVTFRNLNDTKDRVTAEMDGSERVDITLDKA